MEGSTTIILFDSPQLAAPMQAATEKMNIDLRSIEGSEELQEIASTTTLLDNAIVLVDDTNRDVDACALIPHLRQLCCALPVFSLVHYGDIPHTVSLMRCGAMDVFEAPLQASILLLHISRSLKVNGHHQLARRIAPGDQSSNQLVQPAIGYGRRIGSA